MKKINESCPGTTTNQTAGNTSQTGTNVLDRTLKNSPENEARIRGVQIYPDDLEWLTRVVGKPLADECVADGTWVVMSEC
ncbi:hypothetical protein ACKUB1_13670 [Methanospirillum stamsii]|uniref:Uncharacterized protein n=1 Tax=Methanospirillum stamsii TaxID=1277351 RepID=A0A2V2NHN6_9EURY|nr:hypothetical protein [Methanospirillum stamsii]PWR74843.1 hypothetical protein DLD82_08065 [Methanospirillum stamsii]